MKKSFFIFLFGIVSIFSISAQTIVKGSVKLKENFEPISGVTVNFEGTEVSITTDESGAFQFTQSVPLGEQYLRISKTGFTVERYPVVVNEGQTLDIDMFLEYEPLEDEFTIVLSDDELNDDTTGTDNISGLLASSRDVFQRTAAFEFSSSFFRVRGLDSDNGSVLINGIEMNKQFNGRPQWSNWGGLNDVVRNQELTTGLTPSAYNFGGVLGTTNINVRASKYREGGRVTYSSSNRSYTNRLMASYASGLLDGGFSYVVMAGRRWGDEGFQDASLYDSNSFFASIEKQIGDKHSLNLTSIYAPNRRGRTSPNTQEVFDLKGIKYNEYWGYFDGKKKNSRIRETEEPIVMLNHYWDISDKTTLNTNVAYQWGKIGSSRLDNVGGRNPSPAYYQNLPSFFLEDGDLAGAYEAEQNFINGGQIDWERIIDANLTNNLANTSAAYVLYEDRVDDSRFIANTIFNSELNENIILNAAVNYKKLKSENFAEIIDLLGSSVGYFDQDQFAISPEFAPNDLLNPDRIAFEGDKFRYNYNIFADVINGYAQAQFKYNKVDFYFAGSLSSTQYQREGLFQNGRNPNNSLGKGDKIKFAGFGAKGGLTYKISGKHLIDVNAGYIQRAPSIRNTFTNSRENHDYVGVIDGNDLQGIDLVEEKVSSIDASYIFRSPIVNARLTGFMTKIEDANEISFFFTQGGSGTGFVQEVLNDVDKKHIGAELGVEAQVTPTIKLKGAASVGQYTYDNNPNLYLTSSSEDFVNNNDASVTISENNTVYESKLKDYKVAGGPQKAYSVGFEYRDPAYWWFGATANFFSEAYIDVSPLARTDRFFLDSDGLPFNDYDPEIARELLRQEQIDDYMVVNLVGGKSWKIGDYFVGFFASVGNLLDKEYKTGGFEQGRRSDYRTLRDEVLVNPKRQFGPKYWYGRGTNYFLNVYFRF